MTRVRFLASGRATAEINAGVEDGVSSVATQILMTCHSEEPRDEESASGFASIHDKRIREITNA
jgi:hypothetical protein